MTLNWRGDAVQRNVGAASRDALNDVARDAAEEAARLWPVETGLSRASIAVLEEARSSGDGSEVSWGARPLPSGDYDPSSRQRVLFTEIGFRGKPGRHILRRTGDRHYGRLASRIRAKLR